MQHLHRRGQRLERGLLVGGFVSIVALALALLVGANAVNGIARGWEEDQLANGLKSRSAELEAAVVPQVDWDDAIQNLQIRFDPAWAQTNIGAYLTQTAGFQAAYVLDVHGKVVFENVQTGPRYSEVAPALAPLVRRIRRREAARPPFGGPSEDMVSRPIQETTVVLSGARPVLITASLVQPDFGKSLPDGPAPIVVTHRLLDAGFVDEMSRRYQLEAAHIRPGAAPDGRRLAKAPLVDHDGKVVATVHWVAREPGTELFRRVFAVLVVGFALLAGSIWFLREKGRKAFVDLLESQEALRAAVQRAEGADRAKSEFLATMSHEIRTPLNSVFGALHLLKHEPISPDARQLVDNALASGDMVGALINDVLDYSKIAAGKMELAPDATDLQAVLQSIAAAFAPACEAKGVALRVEMSGHAAWAVVDPLRVRQCLFNLVGNAVKFTPAGSISVSAELRDDRFVVEVDDTGIGISPENLARLFDRFSQVDGSATRRFGGTGLGLAITRELALMMGGDVTATSEPGVGSVFRLCVEARPCAPAASETLVVGEAPLEGMRVLLVDDNLSNLSIGGKILERVGATVTAADSGATALALAATTTFDLVLMDIQMPDMDGMQTTARLRASGGPNASTPVIALTANVLEDQQAAYRAAGMNGVCAKPISPAQLLAEILALGQGRQGADPDAVGRETASRWLPEQDSNLRQVG